MFSWEEQRVVRLPGEIGFIPITSDEKPKPEVSFACATGRMGRAWVSHYHNCYEGAPLDV